MKPVTLCLTGRCAGNNLIQTVTGLQRFGAVSRVIFNHREGTQAAVTALEYRQEIQP